MKVLGRIFALSTITFGLLIAASGNTADAGDRTKTRSAIRSLRGHRPVHIHYQVMYSRNYHWHVYGTFSSYHQARHAAHRLKDRGYHAHIRRVR